ncbi:AzlC family ABC transporter permease [Enterococcus faecium]|nr:AzlC family ABC transporter permease [Enterococcus faecium]
MSINHAKKQYLDGVRSGVPVILGFIPVGIAYAVMARQTGLTVFETILMSICVFAGASQMMVVGMYAQDASIAAMVLAVLLQSFKSTIK